MCYIVITDLNLTVPFIIASGNGQLQISPRGNGDEGGHLLKASFAFASGNFSTMQSTFLISVNAIASSESVA